MADWEIGINQSAESAELSSLVYCGGTRNRCFRTIAKTVLRRRPLVERRPVSLFSRTRILKSPNAEDRILPNADNRSPPNTELRRFY